MICCVAYALLGTKTSTGVFCCLESFAAPFADCGYGVSFVVGMFSAVVSIETLFGTKLVFTSVFRFVFATAFNADKFFGFANLPMKFLVLPA